MRKIVLILATVIMFCAGQTCSVPTPTADAPNPADITNWDFSPCWASWEGFETCKALLTHNQEVILGGYTFLDVLFYNIENNLPTSQAAPAE